MNYNDLIDLKNLLNKVSTAPWVSRPHEVGAVGLGVIARVESTQGHYGTERDHRDLIAALKNAAPELIALAMQQVVPQVICELRREKIKEEIRKSLDGTIDEIADAAIDAMLLPSDAIESRKDF